MCKHPDGFKCYCRLKPERNILLLPLQSNFHSSLFFVLLTTNKQTNERTNGITHSFFFFFNEKVLIIFICRSNEQRSLSLSLSLYRLTFPLHSLFPYPQTPSFPSTLFFYSSQLFPLPIQNPITQRNVCACV